MTKADLQDLWNDYRRRQQAIPAAPAPAATAAAVAATAAASAAAASAAAPARQYTAAVYARLYTVDSFKAQAIGDRIAARRLMEIGARAAPSDRLKRRHGAAADRVGHLFSRALAGGRGPTKETGPTEETLRRSTSITEHVARREAVALNPPVQT